MALEAVCPSPANGRVAHDLSDLGQLQRRLPHSLSIPTEQAGQGFLLSHRADPARNALAAGLVTEKGRDSQQDFTQIHAVVKGHHHGRTEGGADRAGALEGHGGIQFPGRKEGAGRTSDQDTLQPAAPPHSARQFQQVCQSGAEGNFVDSRPADMAGETEKLGSCRPRSSDCGKGAASPQDDSRNVYQGLDVVDQSGTTEKAHLGGKGWLVPGFSPEASIELNRAVSSPQM